MITNRLHAACTSRLIHICVLCGIIYIGMLSQYIKWTNFPVLTDRTNALLLIETLWRTMDVATSKKTKLKTCTKCKTPKPTSEYWKSTCAKDGYRTDCIACKKAYVKEWRKTNRYNLSPEKYKAMLDSQNHCCADCHMPFDSSKRATYACIDHDHDCCPGPSHSCGKCVRSLVCYRCNNRRWRYETIIKRTFKDHDIQEKVTVLFNPVFKGY
jgi:hypothetical protein